jgi:drug/metabolite transporter (DMT)-like permease
LAISIARGVPLRASGPDVLGAAATGALLALHWVLFFAAVQEASIAVATLTFATFPLITIVVESVRRSRVPAIIEIGSGLAIVTAVWVLVARGLPDAATARQGAYAGLLSAVCFAVFSVASQRAGKSLKPVALSLYQNAAVTLLLVPALPFATHRPHGTDWALIAVLGVAATALAHQLYFFALRRLPAAVCGGFVALEPVYAIIFASILFTQPISPTVILSGALIIGASLLLLARSKESHLAIQ